jgi:hypothetical protein
MQEVEMAKRNQTELERVPKKTVAELQAMVASRDADIQALNEQQARWLEQFDALADKNASLEAVLRKKRALTEHLHGYYCGLLTAAHHAVELAKHGVPVSFGAQPDSEESE